MTCWPHLAVLQYVAQQLHIRLLPKVIQRAHKTQLPQPIIRLLQRSRLLLLLPPPLSHTVLLLLLLLAAGRGADNPLLPLDGPQPASQQLQYGAHSQGHLSTGQQHVAAAAALVAAVLPELQPLQQLVLQLRQLLRNA
jgi:hypothetical protein